MSDISDLLFNKLGLKEGDIKSLLESTNDETNEKYINKMDLSVSNEFDEWMDIWKTNTIHIDVIFIHPKTYEPYIRFTRRFRKTKDSIVVKHGVYLTNGVTKDNVSVNDIQKGQIITINRNLFRDTIKYLVSNGAVFGYLIECTYSIEKDLWIV